MKIQKAHNYFYMGEQSLGWLYTLKAKYDKNSKLLHGKKEEVNEEES